MLPIQKTENVLISVAITIESVEMKGRMGFWSLEGKSLEKCLEQLSKKEKRMIEENLLS